MPIFFHCSDGKRLRLQLRGTTVQPPVQRLTMLPEYSTFTFDPVPIGEPQPPIQTYLLRNGGPSPVTFQLDLRPLHTLKVENHGYEVVSLTSETSGEIPPGATAALHWVFNPLEAKVYSVDIPVLLGDGSSEVVTLTGRGFHPDAPGVPEPLCREGGRQWARWDGYGVEPSAGLSTRLALVSQDTLSLGTSLIRVSGGWGVQGLWLLSQCVWGGGVLVGVGLLSPNRAYCRVCYCYSCCRCPTF